MFSLLIVQSLFIITLSTFTSDELEDPIEYPLKSIFQRKKREYQRLYDTTDGLPSSRISDKLGFLTPRQYKTINHQLSELKRLRDVDGRIAIVDVLFINFICIFIIFYLFYRTFLIMNLQSLFLRNFFQNGILLMDFVTKECLWF